MIDKSACNFASWGRYWKERIELDAGSRNLLLKALKMDIEIYKIFKADKRNSQKIPDFRNFPVQDPRKKYFALDLISINRWESLMIWEKGVMLFHFYLGLERWFLVILDSLSKPKISRRFALGLRHLPRSLFSNVHFHIWKRFSPEGLINFLLAFFTNL